MFDETFLGYMQEQKLFWRLMSKKHPKKSIFFLPLEIVNLLIIVGTIIKEKNTHIMIKLKDIMKKVEEITKLKVANVEKENKLKSKTKISEENDKLTKENKKINKDNNILKERLSTIEDNGVYIQSYQCDNCNCESEDRDKKIEHMTENHDIIEK